MKKRNKKLTADELYLIREILQTVYDAMEEEEIPNVWDNDKYWTDGGRFLLALNNNQMFDLFQAIRKLNY